MTPAWTLCAVLALATPGFALGRQAPWLLVNESPSVPRGLYVRSREGIRPGVLVAVRPPRAARSYLAGLGAGPDALLLKRVAARESDRVCHRMGLMTWPTGAVRALTRDRQYRILPVWRGCRRLLAGELLVMGDTPSSFDGRYFGPVNERDIQGTYREVVRW